MTEPVNEGPSIANDWTHDVQWTTYRVFYSDPDACDEDGDWLGRVRRRSFHTMDEAVAFYDTRRNARLDVIVTTALLIKDQSVGESVSRLG